MELKIKLFSQLSTDELYDLLKLRSDVFVVEQACAYADLDEKDRHPQTRHIFLTDHAKELMAYSRVLASELSYQEPSIGRVVVSDPFRRQGLAKRLVKESISVIHQQWPRKAIQIGAQEYLLPFYQSLGFEINSAMYLEDGIPHRDMLLNYTNTDC